MTVYIVRHRIWERTKPHYEWCDDQPVKAYVRREDAEALCAELDAQERKRWVEGDRHGRPAQTPEGRLVRDQTYYEVIAVEYAP